MTLGKGVSMPCLRDCHAWNTSGRLSEYQATECSWGRLWLAFFVASQQMVLVLYSHQFWNQHFVLFFFFFFLPCFSLKLCGITDDSSKSLSCAFQQCPAMEEIMWVWKWMGRSFNTQVTLVLMSALSVTCRTLLILLRIYWYLPLQYFLVINLLVIYQLTKFNAKNHRYSLHFIGSEIWRTEQNMEENTYLQTFPIILCLLASALRGRTNSLSCSSWPSLVPIFKKDGHSWLSEQSWRFSV